MSDVHSKIVDLELFEEKINPIRSRHLKSPRKKCYKKFARVIEVF